ncbi:MAG: sensor histidine kinase [Terrimicrobiaceae bacterium]|nr:sensor histidine kinase [Terrimicrobiaceae bacterium]
MLFLLGGLLFAGFLLTTGASYWVSRDAIRKTILDDELPLTSDNIYSEIQRDLFEPILISSLMANDTFVKDWIQSGEKDVERIVKYLHQIQLRYGTITSFLVSNATSNYYHSNQVLKKVSEGNPLDAWFFRVRGMTKDYEINVDPDMANKNAMTIFINYRVTDREGRFLGATGVGLAVNAVKTLMQNYRRRYHRDIYFYDRRGKLVLNSLGDGPGADRRLPDHVSGGTFREVVADLASGKTEVVRSVVGTNGGLLNYRYIPELDWILVVEQSVDGTRGILLKSLGLNFLICLLTSIGLLGIIRATILRYQQNLESRNCQLQKKNGQIENQAAELAKANARLDAMHREKDEFIGITAHDLKNPLNSVFGFAQLLLDNPSVKDEAREYVGYIHNSSREMLDHVDSLLTLLELDDPVRLDLRDFDARPHLECRANDFRFQAAAKNISISCDFGDGPIPVHANQKGLADVLGNLLSNAVKYSPIGGKVKVAVQAGPEEIRISVKDEGEGISPDEQPRLFQKFGRLSPRPTDGESSSGLGLFIVSQLAGRMGGRVWCESKKGAGATFTVAFPRPDAKGA